MQKLLSKRATQLWLKVSLLCKVHQTLNGSRCLVFCFGMGKAGLLGQPHETSSSCSICDQSGVPGRHRGSAPDMATPGNKRERHQEDARGCQQRETGKCDSETALGKVSQFWAAGK